MGHEINSFHTTMKVSGEDFCKTFGHLWHKYGDGVFCMNCDIPYEEEDKLTEPEKICLECENITQRWLDDAIYDPNIKPYSAYGRKICRAAWESDEEHDYTVKIAMQSHLLIIKYDLLFSKEFYDPDVQHAPYFLYAFPGFFEIYNRKPCETDKLEIRYKKLFHTTKDVYGHTHIESILTVIKPC